MDFQCPFVLSLLMALYELNPLITTSKLMKHNIGYMLQIQITFLPGTKTVGVQCPFIFSQLIVGEEEGCFLGSESASWKINLIIPTSSFSLIKLLLFSADLKTTSYSFHTYPISLILTTFPRLCGKPQQLAWLKS